MLTKEELAARLEGREYGEEITDDEAIEAASAGLIVVFGASDDLIEFRGAIDGEEGAPGTVWIDANGIQTLCEDDFYLLIREPENEDAMRELAAKIQARLAALPITAERRSRWSYETEIPAARFSVMEGGEPYGDGLVIDVRDLPGSAKA